MPNIAIARGDIVLVDLEGAIGGEKQNDAALKARPCVVVQNDGGNRGSPLTIVAPITDTAQHKGYPQQVLVTAAELGSPKDSVIECGHLRTVDRDRRIKKHLGKVAPQVIPRIDAALKASLAL
jgi:mRNA interferase MazF